MSAADLSQLYQSLPFDNRKPLNFAGVKMVAPGDTRNRCGEGDLPSYA